MDNHQADNNRTDDRIHHHGHWRYLIHTTFALLGAAALFLHFSGGGVGGGYYGNFLHGSSSSPKEEGGRRRHDLLRVTSSSSRTRRRTQLLATCNRFHRDPQQCNQIPGCQHNRTACVPRDMMVLQFANKDADVCSQHNSFGRRCKRSGCAWNRLARTCSMPSHECEPFNGRTRVCNSYDQCVFNRNRGVCELMSQTSVVMDECTKKTYRACRFDTANCRWQNRQCVSVTNTGTGTTTQSTLVTLATQLGTTTTTKATTAQAGGTATTTTSQAGGTTTTTKATTSQAGGTTTTTTAQAGGTTTTTKATTATTTTAQTTTKATTATTTTKATTAQAVTTTTKATTSLAAGQTKCLEWHPLVGQSGGDAPICTNTGKVPEAWTKYCQNTNGIIFFQTGPECCAGYFKNAAGCTWKTEQQLQQASAAANACWSWHPSVTDPKTCTNDENYPAGWKQGCPHYNGQLFFETYDSCCDNYFKGLPKTQCNKIDVMNQNSAGLTTTTTTTKATTAATTTTKATTAATTTKATTTAAATTTTTKATTTAATTTKATTVAATTTTTKATTIATTTTPKPSPEPTPGPTQKPTMKPSSGPTAKPTSQPTEPPTKPPSPGPTAQPTKPPSPVPTSPPTRQPTLPPQAVKWYPLESVSGKTCVQGGDYNPILIGNGWTYNSEDACCKAWNLPCGVKAVKWYPTTSNGAKQCVEGTGYPWSFFTSGFLYTTKEKCCQSIQLDCSPKPQKWKPTLVNGQKACVFMEVETYDHQFDSKGECCAAFPLACPTTTTTTTTTRPAVTTPPCTPSGGKGCHWWPKLEGTKIKCVYSSNWPIEASEVLFPDHDACYCEFNAC